jgi:hypothetical protein
MKDLFICSGNEKHVLEYSHIHHTEARRKDVGCSPKGLVGVSETKWLVCGLRSTIDMKSIMHRSSPSIFEGWHA